MNKQQLASKIWESANKMRSKIEANEYKDYILGFMFYKFLSESKTAGLQIFGTDQGYPSLCIHLIADGCADLSHSLLCHRHVQSAVHSDHCRNRLLLQPGCVVPGEGVQYDNGICQVIGC